MPAWPDAPAVQAFLTRVARRLVWIDALRGAAAGLAVAIALLAIGAIGRTSIASAAIAGLAMALIGMAAGAGISATRRRNPAHAVERRAPECRNVLVTAAEIIAQPTRVRDYMGARVCRDAGRVVAGLNLARLFPVHRVIAQCLVVATIWGVTAALLAGRQTAALPVAPDAAEIAHVDVVITPPAYTGRPAQTLRDPARVSALAGSTIDLSIAASASAITLETLSGRQALTSASAGRFTASLLADADGYLAIEPSAATGRIGPRRLIGLSVEPDRPPRVRVTAPGKDLFLPDAKRALALAIESEDDLGLATLTVRYTKVAGSGENFTFTEGDVPLAITRTSDRAWTASGTLALANFDLTPGDMVVYRALATDRRPGSPAAESDSWVVEIVAPGAVAMEGYAVDDERDRYALSQQMVIMKTEQLAAKRATLAPDAFADEAMNIAAEQRRVRAEFVFMMGGELADAGIDVGQLHEEEEAAGESDLAAGRNANQGRIDLMKAIRSMSRAATRLTDRSLPAALVDERAALASLQRAFARSRYILRTLTERERLDLSRRLTGVLAALSRDTRPSAEARDNPRLIGLRRALAGLASIAGATAFSRDDESRVTVVAQDLLRLDPSSAALADVAARLAEAASSMSSGRLDAARAALDRATSDLAAVVRSELSTASRATRSPELGRLDGLLADALRRSPR